MGVAEAAGVRDAVAVSAGVLVARGRSEDDPHAASATLSASGTARKRTLSWALVGALGA
jgi:hypothetical protein